MPVILLDIALADLFLDTFPFNAGTTASDALWVGLPIVTYSGETFASRMAGSLLLRNRTSRTRYGISREYEALALQLARDPGQLAVIKAELALNRNIFPLFNTARFTRH